MSRTRRSRFEYYKVHNGELFTWEDVDVKINWEDYRVAAYTRKIKNDFRDYKSGGKPPKWFKKERIRRQRRTVNTFVAIGKDIPIFKRSDAWDWN